jgi:hypothetical protein
MTISSGLLAGVATTLQVRGTEPVTGFDVWRFITTFINTPAPFSPFTEYLVVLLVLWLLARRVHKRKEDFNQQAQEVLDEKYEQGELSEHAYEKYRQHLSLRPKR